jgi:hypothetical protein
MKWIVTAFLAALLALSALPAAEQDDTEETKPPEDDYKLEFDTGYVGSSTEGNLNLVAEYTVTQPNPYVALSYHNSPYDKNFFKFDFSRRNSVDAQGSLLFDGNRVWQLEADYDGLLHRLDHDPLTNLQAVSEIKVVRSTDYEPDAEYQIDHKVLNAGLAIRPPGAKWLTLRVGAREQQRTGMRQQLNASHCTSCHVTGQGREIDQSTTDLTIGAHFKAGRVDIDYEHLDRSFTDNASTLQAPYERAYHPANVPLNTPFDDRLWFQNGDFPVAEVPDLKKTRNTFKIRASYDKGQALNFTLAQSETKNEKVGNSSQFVAYRGLYSWRPGEKTRVNFWGRHDEIDNDTLVVDLPAVYGPAPATTYPPPFGAGTTFQIWRDGLQSDPLHSRFKLPDFEVWTRQSTLNRTNDHLGVDAVYRPYRYGSLRLGYQYSQIDREYVTLGDGTGETTRHTLKASWNQRIARKLRWNTSLRYVDTTNPYVAVDAGCRQYLPDPGDPAIPAGVSPSPPGPKGPNSLQYYELQQLRVADLTNVPSKYLALRSHATWSKGHWAVSGSVRYRDAENDTLDMSKWTRDTVGAGVNLWVGVRPDVHFTAGIDTVRQETDTKMCVPIMDG